MSVRTNEHMREDQRGEAVEPMHKRRETMEDGRRYIIYYTFGADGDRPVDERDQNAEDGNNV